MIIGVLADTHGKTESICRHLKQWKLDYLLFAGDYYNDGQKIARALKIKCLAVKGNCDSPTGTGTSEEIVEILDKKIYLVHGHQFGVKQSINRLYYRAQEMGADVVIYGHTHTPHLEYTGELWMINPGSPSRPRLNSKGSYVLIEMDTGIFEPRLISL